MSEAGPERRLGDAPPFRSRGALVRRCPDCRLPHFVCICAYTPRLQCAAEFWLLMHRKEVNKPTNTGRLIADCLPDTPLFLWDRLDPGQALEAALARSDVQPWVVFPAPPDKYEERLRPFAITPGKRPAFLLLDGTWTQAGKMFRKSAYLQHLPILALNPEKSSNYRLRRAIRGGQLCTVEVAAELMRLTDDAHDANTLEAYFRTFTEHYLKGRDNQRVREPTADMDALLRLPEEFRE